MKRARSDWRKLSNYDHVDHAAAPDIGWEWLRRNDDYCRDYAAFAEADLRTDELTERASRKWGLRFPGGTAVCGHRDACILAA